jgi:phosphoserine phosphatase
MIICSAEYNDGVTETISNLDRIRFEPVIVSGGFRELARRAQHDVRIHHAFCACKYIFGED